MPEDAAPPWLPDPEQIEAWLGGFRVGYYHESLGAGLGAADDQPVARPRLHNPALLYAALFDLVGNLLLRLSGSRRERSEVVDRPPPRRRVLVHADAEGVLLRGAQLLEQVRWRELIRAVSHDSHIHLQSDNGTVLVLPHDRRFAPIWRTATNVVRARASHVDSMARGLSRPEGEGQAERGLSVVD